MAEVEPITLVDIQNVQKQIEEIYSVMNMIGQYSEIKNEAPPKFDSYDVVRVMKLLSDKLLDVANDLAGFAGSFEQATANDSAKLATIE